MRSNAINRFAVYAAMLAFSGLFLAAISFASPNTSPASTNAASPNASPVSSRVAAPKVPDDLGWHLVQRHGSHQSVDVFFNNKGIKLSGIDYTWGVVSRAPRWEAIAYSRGGKNYCRVPYSVWSVIGFSGLQTGYDVDLPPSKCLAQKTQFRGFAAMEKKWNGAPPKMLMMSEDQMGGQHCAYSLIGITGIEAPPQVRVLLDQFYTVPEVPGLPGSFTGSTETKNPMLITLRIERKLLDDKTFDPPPGLRQEKFCRDIFINENDKRGVSEFSEMLAPFNKNKP